MVAPPTGVTRRIFGASEKRKLKKQVGSTSITTGHVATLIYLGSEKRPKSGMFKSNDFKIKNTNKEFLSEEKN